MPPRATSKTAKSTRGFCSTIRALRGPDASARISSRSSITTPSVEVMPTLRPMPLKMWLIIREVVVFPLVPVTATIGIRDGAPGGNSMSTTGLEMNCGSPMVGWVCIRKPGAALTSQMAPPVSRTGSVMSGQMKSMPGDVEPDHPGRLLGDLDVLGVGLEGAVDRDAAGRHVAGERELDHLALGRHRVEGVALAGQHLLGGGVELDPGQHLLVADTAARVGVGQVDQLAHRRTCRRRSPTPAPARRSRPSGRR